MPLRTETPPFVLHPGDVDGPALCPMFNESLAGRWSSKYLSSDNSPLFEYYRWHADLRVLNTESVKSVPYAPFSHPYVERLIGTVRLEHLDHVFYWNALDLERKLAEFQTYYNDRRLHVSLDGRVPAEAAKALGTSSALGHRYRWQSLCRGLYELRQPHEHQFAAHRLIYWARTESPRLTDGANGD